MQVFSCNATYSHVMAEVAEDKWMDEEVEKQEERKDK